MVVMRPAAPTDDLFLAPLLAVAADWRPGAVRRPLESVLAGPALAHYVAGWPRPGDFGVVAEDAQGEPIGAAWCRCFPATDPGYGFVVPDVPEVSVGVVAAARGGGVGRALMVRVIEDATARGIDQLSLSVEVDNFARHLYADLGFEVVAEADGAVTMRKVLTGPRPDSDQRS